MMLYMSDRLSYCSLWSPQVSAAHQNRVIVHTQVGNSSGFHLHLSVQEMVPSPWPSLMLMAMQSSGRGQALGEWQGPEAFS